MDHPKPLDCIQPTGHWLATLDVYDYVRILMWQFVMNVKFCMKIVLIVFQICKIPYNLCGTLELNTLDQHNYGTISMEGHILRMLLDATIFSFSGCLALVYPINLVNLVIC